MRNTKYTPYGRDMSKRGKYTQYEKSREKIIKCNHCDYESIDLVRSEMRCSKCNNGQLITRTVYPTNRIQNTINRITQQKEQKEI